MTDTSEFAGVGTAYLRSSTEELADDDFYVMHGVALGEADITVGQSGVKKLWSADALRDAADTLEGQPLVRDHVNTTKGKVGEVTEAEYRPGVGVIYEAEIAPHYEELAQDVEAGLMEVSVRAYHPPEEELEEDDETGALVVDEVAFDNLAIVNKGASPSNTAEPGPLSDMVGDADQVEASAVIGGEMATAVLSRSIEVESVNDQPLAETDDEQTDSTEAETSDEDSDELSSEDESESESDVEGEEELEPEESDEEVSDDSELSDFPEGESEGSNGSQSDPEQEPRSSSQADDQGPSADADELESDSDDLDEETEDELSEEEEEEISKEVDDSTDELEDDVDEEVESESESAPSVTVATVPAGSAVRAETLSNTSDTEIMDIEYESATAEELGDDLDEPVVVEQEDLEELSAKAEKAESVESELEQLSEKLDEQDSAREVVDELSEEEIDLITADEETTVVENEKADMVDEVSSIYAEELAKVSPWGAEELADTFGPLKLKHKLDETEDAELSATIDSTEPEPEGGDATTEELSETEEERELEEAREQYAEELEAKGWDRQAEKVRSGELDPFEDSE